MKVEIANALYDDIVALPGAMLESETKESTTFIIASPARSTGEPPERVCLITCDPEMALRVQELVTDDGCNTVWWEPS